MTTTREKMKRQCVLVLGMHRSGTSLFTGILAKLGVEPPGHLMAPQVDNPRGFWESTELCKVHEDMLEATGSAWNDWGPFDRKWAASAAADEFRDRLKQTIEQEYGAAAMFAVKDPRICRFVPLWLDVLGKLRVEPKVVIPLRHPGEVAQSLDARNGYERRRSYLMWLRYFLDAEFATRDIGRTFVRYGDVIDDWRAQLARVSSDLDLEWPRSIDDAEQEVAEFLSRDLKHHEAADMSFGEGSPIFDWVERSYRAALVVAGGSGGKAKQGKALSDLDRVRGELDASSAIYAPVAVETERVMKRRWTDARSRLSDKAQELNEATDKLKALREQLAADKEKHLSERKRLQAELEDRERKHDEVAGQLERSRKECAGKEKLLEEQKKAAGEANDRMVREKKALETELGDRLDVMRKELSAINQRHAAEREKLHNELMDRERKHGEVVDQLGKSRKECKKLARQLEEAHKEKERSEAESRSRLASLKQDLEKQEASHAASSAAISRQLTDLSDQLEALEKENKKVCSRLQQEKVESARVRAMLAGLERDLAESRRHQVESDAKHVASERVWQVKYDAAVQVLGGEAKIYRKIMLDHVAELRKIRSGWLQRLAAFLKRGAESSTTTPVSEGARLSSERRLIEGSGLFSPEWYRLRYPDVEKAGVDPIGHYIKYGAREGRNPNPYFSTKGYLKNYPDVLESGENPLVHYIARGLGEGRRARPGTARKAAGMDDK